MTELDSSNASKPTSLSPSTTVLGLFLVSAVRTWLFQRCNQSVSLNPLLHYADQIVANYKGQIIQKCLGWHLLYLLCPFSFLFIGNRTPCCGSCTWSFGSTPWWQSEILWCDNRGSRGQPIRTWVARMIWFLAYLYLLLLKEDNLNWSSSCRRNTQWHLPRCASWRRSITQISVCSFSHHSFDSF